MRFSVITPVAGLERFATLSMTHLLLSHVTNTLYWKFYEKLSQDPKQLLILDNSEYEGQMRIDRILECLHFLKPTVVVLPDRLGESKETFEMSRQFIREWGNKLQCDFMYVPQCAGDVRSYLDMLEHIRIMRSMYGIKWFGLPRYLCNHGISRAELCIHIKRLTNEWGDECYVHALGMANGSLRELRALDDAQCDSIDSSAPVWRGWNGYNIENQQAWDVDGTNCNFDVHPNSLTEQNAQLILQNLRKVGVQC